MRLAVEGRLPVGIKPHSPAGINAVVRECANRRRKGQLGVVKPQINRLYITRIVMVKAAICAAQIEMHAKVIFWRVEEARRYTEQKQILPGRIVLDAVGIQRWNNRSVHVPVGDFQTKV